MDLLQKRVIETDEIAVLHASSAFETGCSLC
jgi:hypothetical protein